MSDDSRPLYVMDDDYIEQKYVKAEEERQKQAIIDRERRQREEAEAFAEAEKQRKAAEAERRRKKEEREHQEKLEKAREARETAEKKRRQQQDDFEENLRNIEEELNDLEVNRSTYLSEKLSLVKGHKDEEDAITGPLKEIDEEKRALLKREAELNLKLKEFKKRAEMELTQQDQKEKARVARISELTQKRRQVQNDMLHFLQQPLTLTPEPKPQKSYEAPKESSSERNSSPYNFQYQPTPVTSGLNAMPSNGGYGYPTFAPSAPTSEMPGIEIVGNDKSGSVYDTDEQIRLLDEFLETGVLTQPEYEDAKNKVLADAKKAKFGNVDMNNLPQATAVNNSYAPPPKQQAGQASVESQVAQLDEFFKMGVLSQAEYNDAKEKIYADAKAAGNNSAVQPQVPRPSQQEEVLVSVPQGARPGTALRIRHKGMQYDVTVPPGLQPGNTFRAIITPP